MALRQSSGGLLVFFVAKEPLLKKELAEAIDKDQTTVVRMIQSMERKGIVKKALNEQDRRSHNLFLTEKGDELKKTILPVVTDAHHFVTSNLSEEEIKVLQSLLNKLYDTRY